MRPLRTAPCGARDRGHRFENCRACQSKSDHESYLRRKTRIVKRRRQALREGVMDAALAAARVRAAQWRILQREGPVDRRCGECGKAEKTRLLIVDVDDARAVGFTCMSHYGVRWQAIRMRAAQKRVSAIVGEGPIDTRCAECKVQADSNSLVLEDGDFGMEYAFACSAHERIVRHMTAGRVREALYRRAEYDGDPRGIARKTPTIAEGLASIEEVLASIPSEDLEELRRHAERHPILPGQRLSRESPLYESRFVAIVQQYIRERSGS